MIAVPAKSVAEALRERGIRIGTEGQWKFRAVTHFDVNGSDIEEAASALAEVIDQLRRGTKVAAPR